MTRPRTGRRVLLLLVPLLAAVVAVGLLVPEARADRRREDVRQEALSVARQQALNLTTISYETADRDLGRIIARATGDLKKQFEAQRTGFPKVLERERSVSVGKVLAAAIAAQQTDAVQVLVAVDATVTTAPTGGKSTSVVKHYRMDMKVVRSGDGWLVSQVAFAGVPQ